MVVVTPLINTISVNADSTFDRLGDLSGPANPTFQNSIRYICAHDGGTNTAISY